MLFESVYKSLFILKLYLETFGKTSVIFYTHKHTLICYILLHVLYTNNSNNYNIYYIYTPILIFSVEKQMSKRWCYFFFGF